MSVVFGEAFWPGAEGFISCSYTVSHGISPGVATLVVPWQDANQFHGRGTLTIRDGIRDPIQIKNCILQNIAVVSMAGGKALSLTIVDRRAEWKNGWIDRWANQADPYPDPAGLPRGNQAQNLGGGLEQEIQVTWGPFIPGTDRILEALMIDCLEAMNETTWEVRASPNAYPTVNWVGANPAGVLQGLIEPFGLRLVYRPILDTVLIDKVGETAGVPTDWPIMDDHPGQSEPATPNSALAFAGDTIYTDFIPLEPVGFERNGEIRKIEDLSYSPVMGWEHSFPGRYVKEHFTASYGSCSDPDQAAALANKYVYRAFRVKIPPGGLSFPDFPDDLGTSVINHRRRIILLGQVYTPEKDATGQFRTQAGYSVTNAYNYFGIQGKVDNFDPYTPISEAFTVDAERGLIIYARPVFRMLVRSPWEIGAATLLVYTSFKVRDEETLVPYAAFKEQDFGEGGLELVESLPHPELTAIYLADRTDDQNLRGIETNETDVMDALDYYLEKSRLKYEVGDSTTRTYAGIFPIDPDAGITQVTWTCGGGQPATTTVSVNREHAHWMPPFAERRRFEKIDRFG